MTVSSEQIALASDGELELGGDPPRGRDRYSIQVLAAAACVSSLGNQITAIAIPWFVYLTTDSATRTGLVAFAGLAPLAAGGIIAGAIVDRIGFKRSSIISDIASGVTVAMIPTLYLLGRLEFWHILVLTFLGALLDAPGNAARPTMLPRLAKIARMPLERANSMIQAANASGNLLGPAVGGVLIGLVGAASALYANALAFGISAALVAAFIVYKASAETQQIREDNPQSIMADAAEGLRYVFGSPFLRAMVVISVTLNLLLAPTFAVLLPVYANDVYGSVGALATMATAIGFGSISGIIIYGAIGAKLPRYPVMAIGALLISLPFWALTFTSSLAVSGFAFLIAGFGIGPINIIVATAMQEKVPEALLARVTGTMSLSLLGAPLGVLAAGVLVDSYGPRVVLGIVAALITLMTLAVAFMPVIREVERQPDPAIIRPTTPT